MDLTFLEQTEYIMDAWKKSVSDKPNALFLTDERHPRGISRRKVDELSGKVYGWLRAKQIGREDFVLICLPRGGIALISILGVWKAGAAFTLVEDNYPPERIAFIKKDCSCKEVIDIETRNEILKTDALPGYEHTDIHDAAFQIIETPNGIVPYLMFNPALYSEKKIQDTVDTFSGLLDHLMKDEPETKLPSC